MFVNYKGRPFMQGITENPAFLWSVSLVCGGAFACAFERVPELNQMLQLVSMPDDAFRWTILRLLAATTIGAFLWDRLMLFGAKEKERRNVNGQTREIDARVSAVFSSDCKRSPPCALVLRLACFGCIMLRRSIT